MRPFYKILIGCFLFAGLVVVFDWAIGTLSEHLYTTAQYGGIHRQRYCLNEANEDVFIFGSSRAAHHYVPQVLEDSLCMSCYNAGSDGQCIYYHYCLLASMIDRGIRPKLIVYDVLDLDIVTSIDATFTLDAALDHLAPHYGDSPAIKALFDTKGWQEKLKLYSKSFRYNSQLVQLIKCNYIPWPENKGYEALTDTVDPSMIAPEVLQSRSLALSNQPEEPLKKEYLHRFIQLCQANDIQLVFVYSPTCYPQVSRHILAIKDLADGASVPFYNCNQLDVLTNYRYFYDDMHLNDSGAYIFSSYLATLLHNHINSYPANLSSQQ